MLFVSPRSDPLARMEASSPRRYVLTPNFASPLAQTIISDGTTATAVNLVGNVHEITDGTKLGSNLFHSFRRFDIDAGFEADFLDTVGGGIANVISRVTGNDVSDINGVLRSSISGADFWFINPAGVVFGIDAFVDVPAAFQVSTAHQVGFEDGALFSAADPVSSTSTLSMATPEPMVRSFVVTSISPASASDSVAEEMKLSKIVID